MKLSDIEDRITKVSDKLWDYSFPRGSTHLYEHDLTENERKVFDLFGEIVDKYSPHLPPPDVLEHMHPLFNAIKRIYISRCMDLFVSMVAPLIFWGRSEKSMEFDSMLMEAQLWNFIFKAARSRNEENAWDNAVIEVFGHKNWDLLPDIEAEPLDPGWVKVEAIMEKYCVERDKKEALEKKERALL